MTTPLRKKLIKLLGSTGLRDFNSMDEMQKAKELYTMMTGYEFSDKEEPKQPKPKQP